MAELTEVTRLITLKTKGEALCQAHRSELRVKVETTDDIVAARQQARLCATQAGFSPCDATLITTAISEIARNILEYASRGELTISVITRGRRSGLQIVAVDQGPGIADIAQVMQDGYSSRRGMGIGLPGTKRLMDEFTVTSKLGCGTTVVMKKWSS